MGRERESRRGKGKDEAGKEGREGEGREGRREREGVVDGERGRGGNEGKERRGEGGEGIESKSTKRESSLDKLPANHSEAVNIRANIMASGRIVKNFRSKPPPGAQVASSRREGNREAKISNLCINGSPGIGYLSGYDKNVWASKIPVNNIPSE